jgi:hypothetical protein
MRSELMAAPISRAPLTSRERRELVAAVRAVTVERVLETLGIGSLPSDEQRVLRVMVVGAAEDRLLKANEIARATGLLLPQLERVCDRLLSKGLIGAAHAERVS